MHNKRLSFIPTESTFAASSTQAAYKRTDIQGTDLIKRLKSFIILPLDNRRD